jgi:hypothetical protein
MIVEGVLIVFFFHMFVSRFALGTAIRIKLLLAPMKEFLILIVWLNANWLKNLMFM